MIIFIIILAVCAAGEIVIQYMGFRSRKKKKQMTQRGLYKFMEQRVLSLTLKNPVTREQAVQEEYGKLFLRIEFLNTKPWMAQIFDLDEYITIGRSRENKICIRDGKISRNHCKIAWIQNQLYLQDMGTANGTKIRRGLFTRIELPSSKMELLQDKDIILAGNYKLKIRFVYGYEAQR